MTAFFPKRATLTAVILMACLATSLRAQIVNVGAGGYLVGGKGKTEPILSDNFKSAPPTHQWYSNLVFRGKNAEREYPHPLALRPSSTGLKIYQPGPYLKTIPNAVMGAMPDAGDLELGSSAAANFDDVRLDAQSDWFIRVAFTGSKGMTLSYGHGSPFVFALFESGGASLKSAGEIKVWSGTDKDAVLGVTINRGHYALFGPTGSSWAGIGTNKLVNQAGDKHYFALAALPDATEETLTLFKKYAYSHVIDTQVAWKFEAEKGAMEVTYTFTTKPYEGKEAGTITALYPHHSKYLDGKSTHLTKLSYPSVRGAMKVAEGSSFATVTPIQGVLPMLPPQGIQDKGRMEKYVKQGIPKPPGFMDTYDEGKHLGKLASLCELAELVGDDATKQQCVTELKRRLETWFTATPGKSATVFTYNPQWKTLVGLKASYGSDWPFNDHHFHYGYFIRAAAEVARCDPAWAAQEKWGGMVNIVSRAIASPDRQDKLFPFLRCFDRYAGHSWASGDAGFADGNNQESSSEAMNAWYGLMLWGEATGDRNLRDLGLYLYTTEMTAIEEYWFDVAGTNFPKDFSHTAVGMVWGGKGAWATWFSPDPDSIHGINYLPFTPGSVYLGRYPEYVKRASAEVLAGRKAGKNLNAGWGDLLLMFQAGEDAATAAKYIDANPEIHVEPGNSRAFLYHWIYTLHNLGSIDRTVSADYPFHNVYSKNGKKTYTVYNMSAEPLLVKFTDGTKVEAKTKGFAVLSK